MDKNIRSIECIGRVYKLSNSSSAIITEASFVVGMEAYQLAVASSSILKSAFDPLATDKKIVGLQTF